MTPDSTIKLERRRTWIRWNRRMMRLGSLRTISREFAGGCFQRFRNWHKHLGFLLRYMQMMRARSPLFFAQKEDEAKTLQTWTVKDVHPDGKTLTLTSIEPAPPPAPFIKNRTITQMREEIQKGGSWLWDFNWALRYCDSVASEFLRETWKVVCARPCRTCRPQYSSSLFSAFSFSSCDACIGSRIVLSNPSKFVDLLTCKSMLSECFG